MAKSLNGIDKECSICGQVKILALFHNDKQSSDGKQNKCKECASLYHKKYAELPPKQEKPKTRTLTQTALQLMARDNLDDYDMTIGDKIALKWIEKSLEGDSMAMKMLLERTEGAVKQSFVVDATVENKQTVLVKSANDLLLKLKGLNDISSQTDSSTSPD
jgi:hypothetical protein